MFTPRAPRFALAAFLLSLAPPRLGIAEPTAAPSDQAVVPAADSQPAQDPAPAEAVPTEDPPDIPGCSEILTPGRWQELKQQLLDPAIIFNQWADDGTMIPASALLQCEHQAWLLAHRSASSAGSVKQQPTLATPPPEAPFASQVSLNLPLPWDGAVGGKQDGQNEPAISIDPTTFTRALAGANSYFLDSNCDPPIGGHGANHKTVALYATSNSGATWTYGCAPWPAGTPTFCATPCNQPGFVMGDPSVAWDLNGNGYAAYLIVATCNTPCANRAIAIAKYNPTTNLWSAVGYVVNRFTSTTRSLDRPYLTIDTSPTSPTKNRLYVTWAEYAPPSNFLQADLKIAYSDNGGANP